MFLFCFVVLGVCIVIIFSFHSGLFFIYFGSDVFFFVFADVEEFFQQCDPGRVSVSY